MPAALKQKSTMPNVTVNTAHITQDVDTPASEMEAQEREAIIDESMAEVMSHDDQGLTDQEIERLALTEEQIKPQPQKD